MKIDRDNPEPGLYPDVPFVEYLAINAINHSILKCMARTAKHARNAMVAPASEATKAQVLGDATHAAILEPQRFEDEYVVVPQFKDHPNKKTHKDAKALWMFDNRHKICLPQADFALCSQMRDAVWSEEISGTARSLLSGDGRNEYTVIWRDEETGLHCKARADRVTTFEHWTFVIDLKTTKAGSDWAFKNEVLKYGYHTQIAWYLEGFNAAIPAERRHAIIAVEKAKLDNNELRYIGIHELEPDDIAGAALLNHKRLHNLADCIENDNWPGWPDGIQPMTLPQYAFGG